MHTALTIAGSDSGGGAGIQADIKTMTAHGVFAMSALTALTAQNTLGVQGIFPVPPDFLARQLDSIFQDIKPQAVKIGMVASGELAQVIAQKLRQYEAPHIVLDPVMVASTGAMLIGGGAAEGLKTLLFPLAEVITPNIPEAQALTGRKIHGPKEMEEAARELGETYGCAVLCKGGHQISDANDLLYHKGSFHWFYGQRIDTKNTHGTGCTLSSAMAANLAKGQSLEEAVAGAKRYLSAALGAKLQLGHGVGPLNHAFAITGEY